uniref:Myosin-2 heavy chain-like n=1 Tax=Nicotiana tabacum TaxID=4097 RepID=A0A1S4A6Z7_TOBAC|nr:PREDICTED: myosin-2 heavy chain-like [Nicotiana tabacum]
MFNEVLAAKECYAEVSHETNDLVRSIFDSMDSTDTEDATPHIEDNPLPRSKHTLFKLEIAEVRELIEKRDAFKLLSEQLEEEAKNLRAELEVSRKDHADLVEQVQQKLDQIDQLRAEMDIVKAESDEWRGKMDRLASEKEAARAQLTSAKIQALKEVHARGFNLSAEIEDAKVLETDAKKLTYPEEEDSECSVRSGGGEKLENPDDEAGSGQDRVSMLHHKAFLMYRDDLKQLEAEVREFIEKRDAFKFLSEQLEEEAKNLRAELEIARKDHADLVEKVKVFEVSIDEFDSVTDGQNSQVQQKLDQID